MIKYNDKNIDFQLVCKAIYFDKIKRKEFFDFLEANRSSISDESILGILDYLKINNWDFLKLQSKMNRLETSNNSSNLFKNQNPKLLVAVMIFSFLGLIILKQLYYGNKPSNNIIFEPTEIGVSNMLNTNKEPTHWIKFTKAYNKNDFEMALNILNKMPGTTDKDSLHYFKGIVSYKLKNFNNSSDYFYRVSSINNNIFYHDSQYFLALSYYRLKQNNKAKELLQIIRSDKYHPYYFEALVLLTKLSEN